MYNHSFSLLLPLLHFLGPQTPKDKVASYTGHMGGGKVTFPSVHGLGTRTKLC